MTTRTYPAGVTSWVDVEAPDVDAATTFYGELFGWTFVQATPEGVPSRYLLARLDGLDVAGVGTSATGDARWSTYVAVDDADAAAERVRAAGGRVLDPPADAGEGGRAVTCADPDGVAFRLWQARRRPGAQVVNDPGSWNFSDLHATDPEASRRFYAEVFGWEVSDTGFAPAARPAGRRADGQPVHPAAGLSPGGGGELRAAASPTRPAGARPPRGPRPRPGS